MPRLRKPDLRKRGRHRTRGNGFGRGGRNLRAVAPLDQGLQDDDSVAGYAGDIYGLLERCEGHRLPLCSIMERQPGLNNSMRAILVDWLVGVALAHNMQLETLFLTVNILDRFLGQRQTTRQRLQLVGVSAMSIAAKFEESTGIAAMLAVRIAGDAYTKEDVLQMEVDILTVLDFVICAPTAAHFMRRFQRLNQCPEDSAHGHMMHYLLELTLLDSHMTKYEPSRLVAAAALLSNMLMKQHPSWPPTVARHCNFDLLAVKACAQEMCSILEGAALSPLQSIRKKFSHVDYCSVATQRWR